MGHNTDNLPLIATKREVARALGVKDQRSLRPERLVPVARVVIGDLTEFFTSIPLTDCYRPFA